MDKKEKFVVPTIEVIELSDKDLIITESAVGPEYDPFAYINITKDFDF